MLSSSCFSISHHLLLSCLSCCLAGPTSSIPSHPYFGPYFPCFLDPCLFSCRFLGWTVLFKLTSPITFFFFLKDCHLLSDFSHSMKCIVEVQMLLAPQSSIGLTLMMGRLLCFLGHFSVTLRGEVSRTMGPGAP